MKTILSIMETIYKLIILKAGMERRINYLRKLGVKIGQNCRIYAMDFSTEPYLIEMGNHVAISPGTKFITHHGATWCFQEELKGGIFGKIKIGNNVFIGIDCLILLNTEIGDNSIIGAGSVVRGKFPDNSVIVGNPAQVVMQIAVQKILFSQNPDLLKTDNLPVYQCTKIIKEHFGIE